MCLRGRALAQHSRASQSQHPMGQKGSFELKRKIDEILENIKNLKGEQRREGDRWGEY